MIAPLFSNLPKAPGREGALSEPSPACGHLFQLLGPDELRGGDAEAHSVALATEVLGTGRSRRTLPVSPPENPLACFRVSAVPSLQACPHQGRRSGGEKAGGLLSAARLSLPPRSGQADLAAIYYERVDVEGHHYGPSSAQRKDAVKAVDTVMAYMTKWIQVTGNPAHGLTSLCPSPLSPGLSQPSASPFLL